MIVPDPCDQFAGICPTTLEGAGAPAGMERAVTSTEPPFRIVAVQRSEDKEVLPFVMGLARVELAPS